MSDEEISLSDFGRFLRWAVPTAAVTGLVVWLLDVDGLRSAPWWAVVLAFPVGFNVILGPLLWLRYEHLGESSKRSWAAFGIAILWAAVTGALLVGLLTVLDVD